jgi:hypothetical protein
MHMAKDQAKVREVGDGCLVRLDGNILHIAVDLTRKGVASKTGKSMLIASTRGIKTAPGDSGVMYSVNAFLPAEKQTEAAA